MNIADWRKQNGMTQARLAELAGLAAPTISQIENGVRRPSPEVARNIERATNGAVSAAGLLGLSKPSGVREETSEFIDEGSHSIQQRERVGVLEVKVPVGMLELATEYCLEPEVLVLAGGLARLEAEIRRVFRERNAGAIEWTRRYVEENGTLSQQFGMI